MLRRFFIAPATRVLTWIKAGPRRGGHTGIHFR